MTTSTPEPSRYIHGTDPAEQHRLSRMNAFLNEGSLREIALRGGERVLDVGSGLGQLSRAMGRSGVASVVGVERSPEQLRLARELAARDGEADLVDFREGDALAMPLAAAEWGTFDVVHARFVLEHVPDPLAVVRQMVRAARPGGRVILEDDDHEVLRAYPEPLGFSTLWTAYMRCYDRIGNDPYVGRRLVALLHDAGARPSRNAFVWFGCCAGNELFSTYAANMAGVIETARERMVGFGLISAEQYEAAMAAVWAWAARPDAALWYPMCYAEGTT